VPDYVSARRIINGLDHAADIAAYAEQFELLLRGAEAAAPARRAGRRAQAPRKAKSKSKSRTTGSAAAKRKPVRGRQAARPRARP